MGQNSDLLTAVSSAEQLAELTGKQRAVLDMVLEHKSSKEIARALCISPYTVDQRIASARQKLSANSRGELARKYARLLNLCEETACEFSQVADDQISPQSNERDQPAGPLFMLSDATSIKMELPWHLQSEPMAGLEAVDDRFGVWGRVLIIPALAALMALLALAVAAIAMMLPMIF